MAGTIPFSLSQQLDDLGKPLAGGQFYTIVAGTTSTPQNAFQDSALTIPLPNPQTCDAAGRLPQFFLADGSIKIRLTDVNGVTVLVADNIQVIGASSGGGGGGTVDPTTVLTTGDIKATYGVGVISGFVRLNGRTLGSATSGATERANLDTQALFTYLWNTDANLAVSTGRGISPAADWAANKTITLPDARGRAISALDDMGSTAAGRLTATYFGTAATVLGAVGGSQSHTLVTAEIPAVPFSAASGGESGLHNHFYDKTTGSTVINAGTGSPVTVATTATTSTATGVENQFHTHTSSGNISGGGGAHAIVGPRILVTVYIKL